MREKKMSKVALGLLAMILAACGGTATTTTGATETTGTTGATETTETTGATETTVAGGENIYLMGADGLISATFMDGVGETGIGMHFSAPGQPDSAGYQDLAEKYQALVGTEFVQAFHARAYDAATIVFAAIETVAEEGADGSLVINRKALIDALYMTSFEGLTTLSCNEFGDCARPVIAIHLYDDAAAGLSGVVANVLETVAFELPDTGIGVIPADAPADLGELVVAAGDPIEFATMQTISGDTINLGQDQVDALRIAFEDRGEILGHPVELSMIEDELCSADGGTTASQRVLANPNIVAVLGTSCSGAAVPAAEALAEAGIPLISGSNTSPFLTATGYFSDEGPVRADNWHYGYFRTAHNDEFQGRAAAQFAYETLGVRTAATIHDGDPYTVGLAGAFGASFIEFGGEVVLATSVAKDQEDMRPVLTEVAASGAEILFFPIFEPAGPRIVLQAPDVGLIEILP